MQPPNLAGPLVLKSILCVSVPIGSQMGKQRKMCDTKMVEEETWRRPVAEAHTIGSKKPVITEKEKSNQGKAE